MPSEDERMNSVMLSIIRRRTPSADVADFDKQIYDLDMDSLDVVDLSQALEKEFGVEADLERVADCLTPARDRFLLPRTDRIAVTAGIVDIATATPGKHVDNSHFDDIGLTDEWIRRRTGVAARWWMDPDEPLEDARCAGLRPAGRAPPRRDGHRCSHRRQLLDGRQGSRYRPAGRQTVGPADRRPGARRERRLQRLRVRLDLRAVAVQARAGGDRVCRRGDVAPHRQDRIAIPARCSGTASAQCSSRSARRFGTSHWHAGSDGDRVGLMTG